jgi:PAS domain-containing protein
MSGRPTYEELVQRVKQLEKEASRREKAEEMLLKTRKKLADALRLAHTGIWVWDVQTGEVEWSDEVYRIFEMDPQKYSPDIDSIYCAA